MRFLCLLSLTLCLLPGCSHFSSYHAVPEEQLLEVRTGFRKDSVESLMEKPPKQRYRTAMEHDSADVLVYSILLLPEHRDPCGAYYSPTPGQFDCMPTLYEWTYMVFLQDTLAYMGSREGYFKFKKRRWEKPSAYPRLKQDPQKQDPQKQDAQP